MFEEAWCETCSGVSVELEVFDERNIGKLPLQISTRIFC